MDERRNSLALFLCIVVAVVYYQLVFGPRTHPPVAPPQVVAAQQPPAPGTAGSLPPPPPSVISQGSTQLPPTPEKPADALLSKLIDSKFITFTTKYAAYDITLLGGRIRKITLAGYKQEADKKDLLVMYQPSSVAEDMTGGIYFSNISDREVQYKVVAQDANSFILEGKIGADTVRKEFSFKQDSYLFDITASATGSLANSRVWLEWNEALTDEESTARLHAKDIITLSTNKKLSHTPLTDLKSGEMKDLGASVWTGVGNGYFLSSIISDGTESTVTVGKFANTYLQRIRASVDGKATFHLFSGPKSDRLLKDLPYDLHRSIDLGWFSFIAFPLLSVVRLFESLFNNYGLAIILLVLGIKLLFLPLTKASIQSAQAMQDLQPQIAALKERIKDPTQLNQEVMAMYKKKGVNPVGGCFPILIQIPVFLGLYNALMNSIELRHAPFALWIQDLSSPEALHFFGVNVPIMLFLMAGTMYYQQVTGPQPTDPQQAKMMKYMPLIFTGMFVLFPMPAGLVLYWLVSNIISIIQQMYLRGHKKGSALKATAFASIVIFSVGFALTLI